jgi:hypothetical protein
VVFGQAIGWVVAVEGQGKHRTLHCKRFTAVMRIGIGNQ